MALNHEGDKLDQIAVRLQKAAWTNNLRNVRELDDCETGSSARALLDWITLYIVRPNNDLGRPGPVCPYVSPAIQLGCVWVSINDANACDCEAMCQAIESYCGLYRSFGNHADSGLKTFVIAYPQLDSDSAPSLIDRVHWAMKSSVVERGLMLGEFYPNNRSPGIHNPAFPAASSPMPLFVLRQMVPGDLIFLDKPSDPSERRIQFILSYLRHFESVLSAAKKAQVHKTLVALGHKTPTSPTDNRRHPM